MKCSVMRDSFYRGSSTLRFKKHSPGHESVEPGFQCGCTQNATVKPDGEPDSVRQHITFSSQIGARSFKLEVEDAAEFTLRWEDDDPDLLDDIDRELGRKSDPHAYFWFLDRNVLKIEVTRKGSGYCNCLLSKVIFGNSADVSEFRNGSDPPETVDLDAIGPDGIWCYEGLFGDEKWAILEECDEVSRWRDFNRTSKEILAAIKPINARVGEVSVDQARDLVLATPGLVEKVERSAAWLAGVLDDFDRTEMFRVCDKIDRATRVKK